LKERERKCRNFMLNTYGLIVLVSPLNLGETRREQKHRNKPFCLGGRRGGIW